MSDGKMTVKEALFSTREILYGISVPMALKEQIADKLDAAIKNLTVCISAITKAEQEENNANADIK